MAEEGRWDQDLKFEIPEFHGRQLAEELLDWFVTVDEIIEVKRVPTELQVAMIAIRFRGTAAAWWTQLKTSRARLDKPRISSWDKLKKKMRNTFLPFNYEQTMLQRLNKLQQEEGRCVREYHTEFFKLLTHIDLQESEKQIVARFVGGLRHRIRKKLDVLNLVTLAEALQQALTLEARFYQDYQNRQKKGKKGLVVVVGVLCVAFGVLYLLAREERRHYEVTRQLNSKYYEVRRELISKEYEVLRLTSELKWKDHEVTQLTSQLKSKSK